MAKQKKQKAESKAEAPPPDPKIAIIAQVDSAVREFEHRYGPGRLIAACSDLDLAGRMDRQRTKYNAAIYEGTAAEAEALGQGLLRGYQALERAYLAAGGQELDHSQVIEAPLDNGSILAICADITHYKPRPGETRDVLAIGSDVVAELFDERARKTMAAVARHWPGSYVESARAKLVDDEIPF